MKIQEIKINDITYVPTDKYGCVNCALKSGNNSKCVHEIKARKYEFFICELLNGYALKVKED